MGPGHELWQGVIESLNNAPNHAESGAISGGVVRFIGVFDEGPFGGDSLAWIVRVQWPRSIPSSAFEQRYWFL